MATVGIGGQLNLVDGEEIDIEVAWHGFDGADPIAGVVGFDFFFASDQRDIGHASLGDDAVVNFAGQQAQRQANKPRVVAEHALDGQMGFTGVRWTQDRGDVADTGSSIKAHVIVSNGARPWARKEPSH